ncbi:MAG TPA: PIN domain-containing protein [Jatrophihabitans sp.]|nr:PIN domain-containing protein [Jatrophihabitans sp.]
MRVLLDTSVLLGPELDFGDAEIAISAISLAELHFGVLIARTASLRAGRLRRVGLIEKTFDALPVDDAVAREYGNLAAAVVQAGRQPHARVADLLIAATARTHDAELWTRNADDLIGLESLLSIRSLTH